jgi:hypothetical protein
VVANTLPDPSKGQQLSIDSLEVKRLPVTLTPFIEPTGWHKATGLAE